MLSIKNSVRFFTRKNIALVSKFHNETVTEAEKNYEEVRIPVPWGHIAGKWWGPQDKRPIFVIHGWQDNCGSFDRLIPLLPQDLGFLCVDFPGHGLSSQLPNGIFYHGIDAAIFMRRIQDYFSWDKMSLFGHSMGSTMCFMYSSLFPELVDFTIGIDILKPFSHVPKISMENTIRNINKFLLYDSLNQGNTQPPSYTYEEIIQRQHNGSFQSVEPKYCKYILKRNTQKSGEKYYFSRDQRLKLGVVATMALDDLIEYAKRIKVPYMFIKAIDAPYIDGEEEFYKVIDVMKKNKNFELVYVKGTHHVHLNEPQKIVDIVNPFLKKYAYTDRQNGGIKNEVKI